MEQVERWSGAQEADLVTCQQALARGDLARALLAAEHAPAPIAAECLATLAQLAQQLPGGPLDALPERLARLLSHLTLDPEPVRHLDGWRIAAVLRDRRGAPLPLVLVWVLVGTLTGIELSPVSLPGYPVVRIGPAPGVLIDAVAGGRRLDRRDCQDIVARLSGGTVSWDDRLLQPTRPALILDRMLAARTGAAWQAGERVLA